MKDGAAHRAQEPLAITPAGAVQRTFLGPARGAALHRRGRATERAAFSLPTPRTTSTCCPPGDPPRPAARASRPSARPAHRRRLPRARADDAELDGKRLAAYDTYADGRRQFPESIGLLKAAGRLAVDLARYARRPSSSRGRSRVSNDAEVQYYLGLAHEGPGEAGKARRNGSGAITAARSAPPACSSSPRPTRAPVTSRAPWRGCRGHRHRAGGGPRGRAPGRPPPPRWAARGGLAPAPRVAADRSDVVAAALRGRASGRDRSALWSHLGADPDRVLDLVSEYMAAGLYGDALDLLDRRYPEVGGLLTEPGAVAPQDHPEVVYYRGYAREKLGGSGLADFAAASRHVHPLRLPEPPAIAGRAPACAGRQPGGRDRAFPARHAPPRLRPRARRRA